MIRVTLLGPCSAIAYMSAFPAHDNEKLLRGTVSHLLSHRRITWCDWRVALAAVLFRRRRRLPEYRARPADDRRADGLVYFRVSWNGRTASYWRAAFLAARSRRNFHSRFVSGRIPRERRESSRRHLLYHLPCRVRDCAGETVSATQRFAAAEFRSYCLRSRQRDCRRWAHSRVGGGAIFEGLPIRQRTAQSIMGVASGPRRRAFLYSASARFTRARSPRLTRAPTAMEARSGIRRVHRGGNRRFVLDRYPRCAEDGRLAARGGDRPLRCAMAAVSRAQFPRQRASCRRRVDLARICPDRAAATVSGRCAAYW